MLGSPPEQQRQFVTLLESWKPGQTLVRFFKREFTWIGENDAQLFLGVFALAMQSRALNRDRALVATIKDGLAFVGWMEDGELYCLILERGALGVDLGGPGLA